VVLEASRVCDSSEREGQAEARHLCGVLPIEEAVLRGDEEAVCQLIACGASADEAVGGKRNAVILALLGGLDRAFKALLEGISDPACCDRRGVPLLVDLVRSRHVLRAEAEDGRRSLALWGLRALAERCADTCIESATAGLALSEAISANDTEAIEALRVRPTGDRANGDATERH